MDHITQFKAQLTKLKGQVEKCKKCKKNELEEEYEESNPCDEVNYLLHTHPIEAPHTSTSQKGKARMSSFFMPRITSGA
ncbi:hypothetical protein Lal_00042693 [Lupinus albus]|nr:hypothetical protein Lal_00042693 [Lupinus albus]